MAVGVEVVEVVGVGVEGVRVEVVRVVLESETEELTVAESLSCTRGFLINLSAWERFSEIRRQEQDSDLKCKQGGMNRVFGGKSQNKVKKIR